MTSTIFDIESSALSPEDQLARFEPTFEPDARLKDPEKIKLDLESKKAAWLEKAALDASRARVLVIGILRDGKTSFLEGDEDNILQAFWKEFQEDPGEFIGHCSKSFDIPFLARRSFALGIPVASGVFDGRYINRRVIDTMETWACGEYGARISLDNLARALGVGKKNGNGKDFSELYKTDKAAALAYCANDLALVQKCAVKMGLMM